MNSFTAGAYLYAVKSPNRFPRASLALSAQRLVHRQAPQAALGTHFSGAASFPRSPTASACALDTPPHPGRGKSAPSRGVPDYKSQKVVGWWWPQRFLGFVVQGKRLADKKALRSTSSLRICLEGWDGARGRQLPTVEVLALKVGRSEVGHDDFRFRWAKGKRNVNTGAKLSGK